MDEHHWTTEAESPEALNSGDILTQLKEKIKVQAQRIRSLESYKVLCEERLIELCPSHPLPVQPEHIGSGAPSSSQELLSSKQKIAKLEQQLSQTTELVPSPSNSVTYNKLHELYTLLHQKFNATVKEKNELEESLRNEVIASEEQRAYIEVLKQAIEIRMEALGYKGLRPEEFAEFSQMRISVDESRRETSRITTKVSDYESQIKILTESLRIKTSELSEAISDREILTEQLHQAAEALQFAEEEVQKLEEEKSNLIDYVETQSKIEQELLSDVKDLKTKLNTFQEENRKVNKGLLSATDDNKRLCGELESVKNEFNRNEKMLKDTQQSFLNLKARAEEKDKSIQKYKEENNNLSMQNSGMQAENISLTESLRKVEQELRLTKSLLENLRNEDDHVKETLEQVKSSAAGLHEEKLKLDKTHFETHLKLQEVTKDFENQTQKLNTTQKSLQVSSAEVDSLKNQLRIAAEKEEVASHLLQETKKQCLKFQNELDNVVKVQQATSQELKMAKSENEESKMKIASLCKEKEVIEGRLREYSAMLESESQNFRLVQSENQDLLDKVEELNKLYMDVNENCQNTEQQLRHSQRECEKLNDMLKRGNKELEEERHQRVTHYEEVCKVSNENEKIKRELIGTRENLELAVRAAKGVSSHLGAISSSLFKESFLVYCDKSSEESLHKWVEAVIRELVDLTQKYTETVQSLESLKHKHSLLQRDFENLTNENSSLKYKESLLKNQLETSYKENLTVKEGFKAQQTSLQQEIISLRDTMTGLYEEIDSISKKNRNLNSEIIQLKSKLSTGDQVLVNSEKKYKILQGEKEHLERLLNKSPLRSNI